MRRICFFLALVTGWFTLASAQTSPYTGVAVSDIKSGNDYYLYNVESGLWLQNNDRKANDWSTRAQLGSRGLDFQLNAVDGVEGGYKINAKFGRASISRDNYYLDNNDDHVWIFEAKVNSVSNAVTIKSDKKYLTADSYTAGNPYNNMYKVGEPGTGQWYLNNPENSTNGTWQIVTKAERLEKMASATSQSPEDATWLIKSPDFANNDTRYNSWTKTGTWGRGGDADGDWGRGSMIVESWNSGSDVEISQVINVPNGIYELTLQGFYRDGSTDDVGPRYVDRTEQIRAKFYANNVDASLRSIIYPDHTSALIDPARWPTNAGSSGYYVPNSMADCSRAMNLENVYHNAPIRVIVTDGTLEIGVKKTGSVANDWVIIDNFKLTYYGALEKENWDGANDAILPSVKYGGSYSAYTKLYNAGYEYGDWNTSNQNYNIIIGTPAADGNGNAWYAENNYSMTDWTYGNSALPEFGDGKPADIYVRRYFVVNNTLPSTVYMPAPHDDSPCEYYINGTLVWSRTGTEPGVNGWEENEVVRLTDEQKALIHTDGTVNVFAFHVHQNWGGRYADGGLYGDARTDGTPSKRFRDDANRSLLENVFNQFSVSDLTTWYGISSETANKAKAACNYLQDASYYFDQLFPAAITHRVNTATAIKNLGKMSSAGTSALNEAITAATAANNKDNYVSDLIALNDAINAAVIDLKKNQAEKSTQPTIFTMISESVVGTDDNNYGAVVTNHADGFYVYNVGTGRWFCGGDDWGAHAAVGFPGIKITTPADDYGSGQYNGVVTWLFNGNWNEHGKLNHGGYCDTDGNGWKFWQKDAEHGIYTWSRNGSNNGDNSGNGYGTSNLVGFASSTYARVNTNQTGADNPYNQWIFVTEAQRDEMAAAAMATASESNPVDLTYKIKMPGFNQRERKEGTNQGSEELDWTCNHANYRYNANDNGSRLLIMGRGDNHADFVCDVFGGQWNDAFSLTQTITGLAPGMYRVKVQGYNKDGEAANKAYLVANGQKAALVDRSSESVLPWTTGLPDQTFDNPEYFQAGLYWNNVICTVGSNGQLTLGVESPSVTGSHVFVFDNFRLEYIGTPDITIAETDTEAPSVFDVPANVTLTRTLTGGQWNGFSLPFSLSADQIAASALNGAEIKQFSSVDENTITLADAKEIVAGDPYLIKPEANVVNPAFTGVTVLAIDEAEHVKGTGDYKFAPHLYATTLDTNGSVAYVSTSDSSIKKLTSGSIKGLRSIFNIPVPAPGQQVKALIIQIEDSVDGILTVDADGNLVDGNIYNVAGQRMNKLQRGVNIVNGKKVLVK